MCAGVGGSGGSGGAGGAAGVRVADIVVSGSGGGWNLVVFYECCLG